MRPFPALFRPLLMLVPAITLAACGSSREEDLSRQLEETKAQLAAETKLRKEAEARVQAATSAQASQTDLDSFYAQAGESGGFSDDSAADPEVEAPPPPPAQAPNAPAGI